MAIYYELIVILLVLGVLAQNADYPKSLDLSYGRILHSSATKFFFLCEALILICIAGLRYRVGTDYGSYYYYYKDTFVNNLAKSLKTLSEPGYGLISWVATKIYDDGAMAIFLASLITIGLSMKTIFDNTDCLFGSVLLFVFLECWHTSFNAVRQCLAAAVVFSGFESLRDKKLWKYALCVFLAFLFHKSAIVMILLFFVVHRKTDLKNVLLLIGGSIAVTYCYDYIFQFSENVLNDYTVHNSYVQSSVNILRVLVMCAPVAFFRFAGSNTTESYKYDFYFNIILINAAISIASSKSTYLARITIYTLPFTAISINELMKTVKIQNRSLYSALINILYCMFFLYDVSINPSLNNFMWIWER